jgi:[acyl-carrier-protein] S-malonyltransferase
MQEAVPVGKGAMAAILGLAVDKVQDACNEVASDGVCQPANINSPEQVVISGATAPVERAAQLCKDKGAKRAVMLPVSAPFHCAMMQPAQDRLAADLQSLTFYESDFPVIANIDAESVTHAEQARDTLTRQVTGTVQWVQCIQKLIALGTEMFVEVGPGKVLSGLMRQIDRSKLTMNVENEESLQKLVNHLEQHKTGAF